MSTPPGTVAITGDAWLNERAQAILTTGLPALPPMPGEFELRRFDPADESTAYDRRQVEGEMIMAVTSKSAQPEQAGETKGPQTPAPAADRDTETRPVAKPFDGNCVVDDGTAHMGRAVPGTKICSAHAMRYKNDGTPRTAL